MLDSRTLLFFGKISAHPDFLKIKEFTFKHGVTIKETATPLYDYGGLFILWIIFSYVLFYLNTLFFISVINITKFIYKFLFSKTYFF